MRGVYAAWVVLRVALEQYTPDEMMITRVHIANLLQIAPATFLVPPTLHTLLTYMLY